MVYFWSVTIGISGWLAALAIYTYFIRRLKAAQLHNIEQSQEGSEQQFSLAEKSLKLLELKEKLEEEQQKTDQLLHNILPDKIIQQLQDTGQAKPEYFNNVTVFFSDMVNFTEMAANIPPEELIAELSDIFGRFDEIFTRHHCERIKTIGDAYLCVSGLPTPDANHCSNILEGAFEALEYLKKRNQSGKHCWEMRIGVHSGGVVAGIVGTNKYIYDVFGDTVNTSSRLEQHSAPMQINVSETTRELAGDKFNFSERRPVTVKGKGEMKMYFAEKK